MGRVVGVDAVHADCDPGDKLILVRAEQDLAPTIMVGDGINDAPALAAAGVGVALAARGATASAEAADIATAQRLYAEHRDVRPLVERVRTVADALNQPPYDLGPAGELLDHLEVRLLAHEHAEEAELLPIMARALGGVEATSGLSRTHAEIEHQIGRLRRTVDDLVQEVEPEDVTDVRRLLYGLYAILRLHNAQEEEGAFSLVPDPGTPTSP